MFKAEQRILLPVFDVSVLASLSLFVSIAIQLHFLHMACTYIDLNYLYIFRIEYTCDDIMLTNEVIPDVTITIIDRLSFLNSASTWCQWVLQSFQHDFKTKPIKMFEYEVHCLPPACFRGYGYLSALNITICRIAFGRAWYCAILCKYRVSEQGVTDVIEFWWRFSKLVMLCDYFLNA